MKLSINRNIIWCDVFVERLSQLGVRHACISPGSRNTPLIISFASNRGIMTHSIVDERSSAFFALGLARKTNSPVVIVTTSGTAVAEVYPAIIEAYYQRIPLIICTADRPPVLINTGANQTINQQNIYKNHIRFFADAGLPGINRLRFSKRLAEDAVKYSLFLDKGPVHINFPFKKPFEPDSYTDKIEVAVIEKIFAESKFEIRPAKQIKIDFVSMARRLSMTKRGLILAGFNNYGDQFGRQLTGLAKKLGYPVYIDGASSLRFGKHSKENIIENLSALVRSKNFVKEYDPEIIIQFGGAPTASVLLEFFKNSNAQKILVNEFGDRNDPSLTAKEIIAFNPSEFCEGLSGKLPALRDSAWIRDFRKMNSLCGQLKNKFMSNVPFPFEGRVASQLFDIIPDRSTVMISNSLPIRDVDFFASPNGRRINVFTNRGASGIDGITSTALGAAFTSPDPTYLLIGDLAFYHDLNALHSAYKKKIPLSVLLINNSGGGIFESLPISEYRELMKDNFLTPLELNFSKLVKAFGGHFERIKSWNDFNFKIDSSVKKKKFTVLEIRTDAKKSKLLRQKYWNEVVKRIDELIDEINN